MDNIVICGVDEAGRGPLAGDVFASAVILPKNFILPKNLILTDSKKLTPKKRDILYEFIIQNMIYSIKQSSVEEIDRYNILQASLMAMKRAIEDISLKVKLDLILIDGNQIPKNLQIDCKAIVKGDLLEPSISAASILAKVARDRYMLELDSIYPQYKFKQHKGYPTAMHLQAIKDNGICEFHRKSFAPITKILQAYV